MMKESLGSRTMKMALKKEELIELAKKKEAEAPLNYEKAVRIYNEVVKSLEDGNFSSQKSICRGRHIITVEIEVQVVYNREVEKILNEMFIRNNFESAAYNDKEVVLVVNEDA